MTAAPLARSRMHSDARRAGIFDEAIRIIGERGYRGFSINDLARRCCLTTAGLLHHVSSKEALLVAVLEECDRRDRASVAEDLGPERGLPATRDQALAVLRAIVANNVRQPDHVRLRTMLIVESLGEDHPAHAYFRCRRKAVYADIEAVVAPYAEDAAATARQISATMLGLEVQWLAAGGAIDLVAAWDAVADKLLDGRAPRQAKRNAPANDHVAPEAMQ